MLACYLSLPDEWADKIADADTSKQRCEIIEEVMSRKLCPYYEMDKLWDGLHMLLTGRPSSEPIEGDPLSEAVVGVHVVDAEDDCFIGAIGWDELAPIIAALKQIRTDELRRRFSAAEFSRQRVYPNTWSTEREQEQFDELVSELRQLTAFYEDSLDKQRDVLVSIY